MSSFSTVIFGDMQEQNAITRRIVGLAADLKPDLTIILGDLVSQGRDPQQWASCMALLEPLRQVSEIVALPGNHDYEGPGTAPNFRTHFRQPGELTYLSHRRGGCRFILLDTMLTDYDTLECGSFPADSPQAVWLRDELRQAKALGEPAIVCGHHPIFLSSELTFCTSTELRVDNDGPEPALGNLLPLLLEGDARAYFAGHVHLYEKSVYQGKPFITTGATSYPPPDIKAGGNPFGELRLARNHLCRLIVEGDIISVEAVDEWGEVMDTCEIVCATAQSKP